MEDNDGELEEEDEENNGNSLELSKPFQVGGWDEYDMWLRTRPFLNKWEKETKERERAGLGHQGFEEMFAGMMLYEMASKGTWWI